MIALGSPAPDFSLPDQDGTEHSLKDYRGKRVLLYFYPKDDTPGCTTEACTIRDSYAAFQAQDLVVLGVSADPVAKHRKFADKYELPFPLLSDPTHATIERYGAWQKKKFMGREYMGVARISYLIGPDGTVEKAYGAVKPAEHAAEVLDDLR